MRPRCPQKSKEKSAEAGPFRSSYLRLFEPSERAGWGGLINTHKRKKFVNCKIAYARGKDYCHFRTVCTVPAGAELLADYGTAFKGSLKPDPSFRKKKRARQTPARWVYCETCGASFPGKRYLAHIKGHSLNSN